MMGPKTQKPTPWGSPGHTCDILSTEVTKDNNELQTIDKLESMIHLSKKQMEDKPTNGGEWSLLANSKMPSTDGKMQKKRWSRQVTVL